MEQWIPLTEYSRANGLSISTLRRRIKAGEIEFKLEDGKYLLKNASSQTSEPKVSSTIAPPPPSAAEPKVGKLSESGAQEFLAITHELVGEIKKAFSLVLQEKEKQILQLKDEVADLKTLVRALEDENAKLMRKQATARQQVQQPLRQVEVTPKHPTPPKQEIRQEVRPARNLITEEMDAASWLNSPTEL